MAVDKLDTVIGTCLSALVGIVFICSGVLPVAVEQINAIKSIANIGDHATSLEGLMWVTVIFVILGLIIVIIRGYSNNGSR